MAHPFMSLANKSHISMTPEQTAEPENLKAARLAFQLETQRLALTNRTYSAFALGFFTATILAMPAIWLFLKNHAA